MLTPYIRKLLIKRIAQGDVAEEDLTEIIKIYYKCEITDEDKVIIHDAYLKVINGEITENNYMDFFELIRQVYKGAEIDDLGKSINNIKNNFKK